MFTRQHYEAIAAALATVRPRRESFPEADTQWVLTNESIAIMLGNDNPRFRREQFIQACERRSDNG